MLTVDRIESPIGPLTVVERDDRLCLLHFGKTTGLRAIVSRWYPEEKPLSEGTSATRTVLRRYFDGDLRVLDSVEVELNGTPFQQRVWNALRAIPAGSTLSYSELRAVSVHRPRCGPSVPQMEPIQWRWSCRAIE